MNEESHFVYGEFDRPGDATRAVSALVDASFEPDEIDVFAVRDGHVRSVPLVHYRPIVAGAMIGLFCGVFAGVAIGLTFGQSIAEGATAPWATVIRWVLAGMGIGAITGALGGLVWWRTKVDIRGRDAEAQRFIVGTTVPEGRASEVELVLDHHSPLSMGHYPVTPGEVAQQHAQRQVLPRP